MEVADDNFYRPPLPLLLHLYCKSINFLQLHDYGQLVLPLGPNPVVLAGIFGGQQNHINGLLLGFASAAGLDVSVGLDDCLGGQFSHRLQCTRIDLRQSGWTALTSSEPSKPTTNTSLESSSIQCSLGAQSHRVVTADHTLDIGIGLEQAFHHVEGFGLAPVGGLLSNHLHAGQCIKHFMVTIGADMGIGVGVSTGQFDVCCLFRPSIWQILRPGGSRPGSCWRRSGKLQHLLW